MKEQWQVEIQWFEDGEEPSAWHVVPRFYKSKECADRAAIRLEAKNMANGASCNARAKRVITD